jgi:hypothetical protein
MRAVGKETVRNIRVNRGDESRDAPYFVFIYIAWHKKSACYEEGRHR